ncbi:MAG TPA: hypothetical protein VMW48_19150 [Vicinamibacterales bacterium]|nr:hypothetical protein [Vicinamibacterales bacterium]
MIRGAAIALTLALLAVTAVAGQRDSKGAWIGVLDEHPAIAYATRAPHDRIAALTSALEAGGAALTFEPQTGYLRSVLQALQVPESSQMLVLSRTGVQRLFTSPANPRALYYNDAVAVGYIRGSPFLELVAHDPEQGVVFYTLTQRATERPVFSRQTSCLTCHVSATTLEIPGFMTRSLRVATDGSLKLRLGSHHVDHRTPFAERWGGWFVTGTHGRMSHLGNVVTGAADEPISLVPGGPLNALTLEGAVDLSGYLTGHSDVVALAVFDHQTRALNLLTRIAWEARVAAHEGRPGVTAPALHGLIDELADYLLFVDEAPITGGLHGTSGFAEWFAAQGVRDGRGRSLHELDLRTRLMRYPCSFTIYSPAFTALPPDVRDAVFARLGAVLSGTDASPRYAHLSPDDRRAVAEILRETLPASARYLQ